MSALLLVIAIAAVGWNLVQRKALSTRVQIARETAREAVVAAATDDRAELSRLYGNPLSGQQRSELRSLVPMQRVLDPVTYEPVWWNPAGSDSEGRDLSTVQVQSLDDDTFAVSVEMTWRGWLGGWCVLSISDDRPPK